MARQKCVLRLSNGDEFQGELIGAPVVAAGEMVFTTGMVGYSEALTDPSYFGQILVFTYPLIGNYGIPSLRLGEDGLIPSGFESQHVHASAAVLAIDTTECFHWNSYQTIDSWLKDHGVPGIVGIDTRHLVQIIRNSQGLLGRLEPVDNPQQGKIEDKSKVQSGNIPIYPQLDAKGFFQPSDQMVLPLVSTPTRRIIGKGSRRIGLVDCGVKWNIIRQLVQSDCEVELLPWNTDFKTVDCSGWLLSNGPGDPSRTGDLVDRVRELLAQNRPILGICLGHQILAKAAGATTERLPFGHRSHNQPVVEEGTRRGYITSQNHGFVVVPSTLSEDWAIWFRNANDGTVEGIRHHRKPFRGIQFHPEAAGGPRDTGWIIEKFVADVRE